MSRIIKAPNANECKKQYTKYIVEVAFSAREDKLEHEGMIPRKLEEEWEPKIMISIKKFEWNALCDVRASCKCV